MDFKNNYLILADNKSGFVEVGRFINSTLDEAEAEARRLANDLKARVVVAVIVVDVFFDDDV